MPTKWTFGKSTLPTIGLAVAGLGVIWENLWGPSFLGWIAITAGLFLILGTQKWRRTPLDWPILILLLLCGLSLFITADFPITSEQVARLAAGAAGFYAVVLWARRRQQILFASMAMISFGVIIALAAPFIVQWNQNKGVPIPAAIYDLFPLLLTDAVHPNVFVSIVILILPLPAAYLLVSRQKNHWLNDSSWKKIGLLLGTAVLLIILLLTKSRGGYIAAALSLFIVIWYSGRRALSLLLALVVLVIGAILIVNDVQTESPAVGTITDTNTIEFRQQVWHTATWMIAEFPYTGIGAGTFNDVATRLYPNGQFADPGAHNLYFQVGVDFGIPGLIAFLAILLLALIMAYSSASPAKSGEDSALQALSAGLFAGLTGFCFHGFVDITVWGTRVAFLPWVIFGLVTAVHILAAGQKNTTT